jgi:hypothetical protein
MFIILGEKPEKGRKGIPGEREKEPATVENFISVWPESTGRSSPGELLHDRALV